MKSFCQLFVLSFSLLTLASCGVNSLNTAATIDIAAPEADVEGAGADRGWWCNEGMTISGVPTGAFIRIRNTHADTNTVTGDSATIINDVLIPLDAYKDATTGLVTPPSVLVPGNAEASYTIHVLNSDGEQISSVATTTRRGKREEDGVTFDCGSPANVGAEVSNAEYDAEYGDDGHSTTTN